MKFNLKMIAAAAAMATLAGGAQADIVVGPSNSGSLVLTAFNTVTNAWYMRDLGFTMSSFLPTGALNSVGLTGSPIVGDRTPTAGLTLNAGNTPNFGDASFSGWFGGQTAADVRWFVSSFDNISAAATGVSRLTISSTNSTQTVSNGQLTNAVAPGNIGGLSAFFNPGGLSRTGIEAPAEWGTFFDLGSNGLANVGQSASLFYFTRTAATGATATGANGGAYQNASGFASVTLAANGDFTYSLAGAPVAEVPLPAAAWLLGAGLLGLGSAVRRRKAAAEAA